jgi:hypothetical protein
VRTFTTARLATAGVLLLYLGALVLRRDTIPAGLNNDAAEETLRGLLLIDAGRFEVLTSVFGIPQETLYLYLVAAAAKILGTTTLAVQLPCWCLALATLWMLHGLARRLCPEAPVGVAWLVCASSIWLFHYARSAIRAVSAPFFLLAFCLLLERAERSDARGHARSLAAGAVLGLGVYAYTSCRVIVIAFLLHAAVRLGRDVAERRRLARSYASIIAAALLVSIPNLLYLIDSPGGFLLRGGYVILGGGWGAAVNLAATVILPVRSLDRFRGLVGPTHIFDGVSAGLTSAGLAPLHPLIAAALLVGLASAWRRRADPAISFLLCLWLCTTLILGVSGPSLTRLLLLLPVYLTVATLGVAALLRRWPRLRPLLFLALLAVLLSAAYDYFAVFPRRADAQSYFSPVATPMGKRARAIAGAGERVVCVVAKDANVVNYLTYDHAASVRVVEFYRRPVEPGAIPIDDFRPDRLLVEAGERFAPLVSAFHGERRRGGDAFAEIILE